MKMAHGPMTFSFGGANHVQLECQKGPETNSSPIFDNPS